jgi:hypothetical protein
MDNIIVLDSLSMLTSQKTLEVIKLEASDITIAPIVKDANYYKPIVKRGKGKVKKW